MKKQGKYSVKWNGKVYKAMSITRSKDCIVFTSPGLGLHITYPKNGKQHTTVEKNIPIKHGKKGIIPGLVVTNKPRFYIHQRPPLNQINRIVNIGIYAGFHSECKNLPSRYELIDLDALNYKTPNLFLMLSPPIAKELDKIKNEYKCPLRAVKFNEVWAIVVFADGDKLHKI